MRGSNSWKINVLCDLAMLADLRRGWLCYDIGNSVADMGNLPFL